jgi:hypothetical protein
MMRARYEELMRRVEVTSVLSESSSRQREVASTLRQENEELRVRNTALSQQQETNAADLRKATEQIETLQVHLQYIHYGITVKSDFTKWKGSILLYFVNLKFWVTFLCVMHTKFCKFNVTQKSGKTLLHC